MDDPLHYRSSSDPILYLSILRSIRSSKIDLRAFQFQRKCSHIIITGHQLTVANIDNFSRITKSQFFKHFGPKNVDFFNFSPFLVIFQILAPDFHTIRNFCPQNGAKIDQLGIVDPSSILTSILEPIRSGQKSFESSDPRGSDRGSSTPNL